MILQAGTAIAFFRGFGHDRELSRRISAATGIKATTSLTAVVEALRVLGIKRPVVATSYLPDIDARLGEVTAIGLSCSGNSRYGPQTKYRYGEGAAG